MTAPTRSGVSDADDPLAGYDPTWRRAPAPATRRPSASSDPLDDYAADWREATPAPRPGLLARASDALRYMATHPGETLRTMVTAPLAQAHDALFATVEGDEVTAARVLRGKAGPSRESTRLPIGTRITRENTPSAITPREQRIAGVQTLANVVAPGAFGVASKVAGPVLGAAAAGAGLGAVQSPDDPGLGAVLGAGMGGTLAATPRVAGAVGRSAGAVADVSSGVVGAGTQGLAEALVPRNVPRVETPGPLLFSRLEEAAARAAREAADQARRPGVPSAVEPPRALQGLTADPVPAGGQRRPLSRFEAEARADFLRQREPTPEHPEGYSAGAVDPSVRRIPRARLDAERAATEAAEQARVRAFLDAREPTPSYPEGFSAGAVDPSVRRRPAGLLARAAGDEAAPAAPASPGHQLLARLEAAARADGGSPPVRGLLARSAPGAPLADAPAPNLADGAPAALGAALADDLPSAAVVGPAAEAAPQTGAVRMSLLQRAAGETFSTDAPRRPSLLRPAASASADGVQLPPGTAARVARDLDARPDALPPAPGAADLDRAPEVYAAAEGAAVRPPKIRVEFREAQTRDLLARLGEEQRRLEMEANDPSVAGFARDQGNGTVVVGMGMRGGRMRRAARITAARIREIETELERRAIDPEMIAGARLSGFEKAIEDGAPFGALKSAADDVDPFGFETPAAAVVDDFDEAAMFGTAADETPAPRPDARDVAAAGARALDPLDDWRPSWREDLTDDLADEGGIRLDELPPVDEAPRFTADGAEGPGGPALRDARGVEGAPALPAAERASVNWRTWFADDAPGARSVVARLQERAAAMDDQLRAAKGYQSREAQVVEAEAFARELVADPLTIDRAKLAKLSGPQVVALKGVVADNTAAMEAASRALASGTLSPDDAVHAAAVVDAAQRATDEALGLIVRESARMGRDLGALRQLARQSVDPDVMLVQAKRLAGDRPLSDAFVLELRRLSREAAEACAIGGG